MCGLWSVKTAHHSYFFTITMPIEHNNVAKHIARVRKISNWKKTYGQKLKGALDSLPVMKSLKTKEVTYRVLWDYLEHF